MNTIKTLISQLELIYKLTFLYEYCTDTNTHIFKVKDYLMIEPIIKEYISNYIYNNIINGENNGIFFTDINDDTISLNKPSIYN